MELKNIPSIWDHQKESCFLSDTMETLLFWLLLLAGLFPLMTHSYFVTLDGPAHLYSGEIIKTLLLAPHGIIGRLFTINPFPVPNWTSHFLFALLGTFLPATFTEKTVIFLYLFFTPLIFRKLVLALRPENRILSWTMVLFVHNQNFYFGFFNFSYGVLFMFLTLWYYLVIFRNEKKLHIPLLGILFLALYFSHLMMFLVTLALILLLSAQPLVLSAGRGGLRISGGRRAAGNLLRAGAAALPAGLLSLIFLAGTNTLEKNPERLSFSRLVEWVTAVRPLLALRYGFPWKSYTYLLFGVILVMTITAAVILYRDDRSKKRTSPQERTLFRLTPVPLFALFSLGSLALLFILPNTILLSERLILLFYLFLITTLALFRYPRWAHYTLAMVVILLHISFTRMYSYTLGDYAKNAALVVETAGKAEPGALILPLNYNEKWIYMHISGYAGTQNSLAVLENYEAGLSWFPVRWSHDYYETRFLDRSDASNTLHLCDNYIHPDLPAFFFLKRNDGTLEIIPYILVILPGNIESPQIPPCAREILDASYKVVRENDFCVLFRAQQ